MSGMTVVCIITVPTIGPAAGQTPSPPRIDLSAVRIALVGTVSDGNRPKSGVAQHEPTPMPERGW